MFQTCIVVGHLGRDPELRYTSDGTPVCGFSMATTRRWTDRNGEQQEKTTWFRVSVFGNQAEPCSRYLTKGRLVLVEGDVDVSAYTAQDGTARGSLELRARTVRFLGGRGEAGEEWPQGDMARFPAGGRGAVRADEEDLSEDERPAGGRPPVDDEEIPF
ncbi:MAG: single-stranded DNA-binding protein [Anaerolineae bacterium]|nr:single-stranded DNA-binding protein [Anaerolineae bacterium]